MSKRYKATRRTRRNLVKFKVEFGCGIGELRKDLALVAQFARAFDAKSVTVERIEVK